jgi:hypothetical protein
MFGYFSRCENFQFLKTKKKEKERKRKKSSMTIKAATAIIQQSND